MGNGKCKTRDKGGGEVVLAGAGIGATGAEAELEYVSGDCEHAPESTETAQNIKKAMACIDHSG